MAVSGLLNGRGGWHLLAHSSPSAYPARPCMRPTPPPSSAPLPQGRLTTLAMCESSREDVCSSIALFLDSSNTGLHRVLIISYETFRMHADKFQVRVTELKGRESPGALRHVEWVGGRSNWCPRLPSSCGSTVKVMSLPFYAVCRAPKCCCRCRMPATCSCATR